jgi:hypothetical protein
MNTKNQTFSDHFTDLPQILKNIKLIVSVHCSVAEPEPHLLVGAGAVTRCGSGSDGSSSDNGIKHD